MAGRIDIMGAENRFEKMSDWLNPLLVREVRQSLRGKYFTAVIIFTSLYCVVSIVCGILWQHSGDRDALNAGQVVFYFIFYLIWLVLCVGMPISAANRFRAERSTGEFELFSITSMSARKVILGKLQASFILGLLLLSVSAPFMMVCYLLRGISALDIFLNIFLLGVFSVVLLQGGIFLGSMNLSKAFFSLLQVGFVLGQFYTSFMFLVIMKGESFFMGHSGGNDIRFAMLSVAVIYSLYAFVLAYLSSVMMLELPNKNKTAPIKLFVLLSSILLPFAFCLLFPILFLDPPTGSAYLFSYYFIVAIPALFSALLVHGRIIPAHPAIYARWRKAPFWKKRFQVIFYQGYGSNLVWYSSFMLIICSWSFYFSGGDFNELEYFYFPLLCFSIFIWAVAGNFIGSIFKIAPSLILSIVGIVAPSIVALFCLVAKKEDAALLLFPIGVPYFFENKNCVGEAFVCSVVFWGIVFVYGIVSYRRQRSWEESLCKKP